MPSKNLVHHRSTEKHSKVLKSSFKIDKGNSLEKKHSKFFHTNCQAILVSSLLLRSIKCGQIDLCVLSKGRVRVIEVKSKPEGISPQQIVRLQLSLEFLSHVFDVPISLEIIN